MKVFLKTVLAIGLVASSSLALAEGKFVFRQPLGGVNGVKNYGLTESEIEQKNIDMCLKESEKKMAWEFEQITFSRTSNYTEDIVVGSVYHNGSYRVIGGLDVRGTPPTLNSFVYGTTGNIVEGSSGDYLTPNTEYRARIYTEGGIRQALSNADFYALYIEKRTTITEETEKYDWCVNNGYPTAN